MPVHEILFRIFVNWTFGVKRSAFSYPWCPLSPLREPIFELHPLPHRQSHQRFRICLSASRHRQGAGDFAGRKIMTAPKEMIDFIDSVLGTLEAHLVTERAKLSTPAIVEGHIAGRVDASTLVAIDGVINAVRATKDSLSTSQPLSSSTAP
jgi:hypothetical protein